MVGRVSEPFCVDVSSHDETLWALPCAMAALVGRLFGTVDVPSYCCVQCVWEGILEDPSQVLVRHLLVHVVDDLFYQV